jgi:hypothetical protein
MCPEFAAATRPRSMATRATGMVLPGDVLPPIGAPDLPAGMGLFGQGRVQAELEAILGTRVDLVPAQDLKPGIRARVAHELVAL